MFGVCAFQCPSGLLARHHHARPVSMIASPTAFPHCRARSAPVRWLAFLALAVAAAFSAAQTPPASDPAPEPAEVVVPVLQPRRPSVDIAIVLPLNTPAYSRAAEAVSAGFVVAAAGSGTTYV